MTMSTVSVKVNETIPQETVEEEYKDVAFNDDDETIDLEKFRADLHKMIEEVYSEPKAISGTTPTFSKGRP